jgi:F0F1-type ATP synthase membrane subunit b/b'
MSDIAVVQTLKKSLDELKIRLEKNGEEISRQLDNLTSFIDDKLTGFNQETKENLETLTADLGDLFSNYRAELLRGLEDLLSTDESVLKTTIGSISDGFSTEEKNFSTMLSQLNEKLGEDLDGISTNFASKNLELKSGLQTLLGERVNDLNTKVSSTLNESLRNFQTGISGLKDEIGSSIGASSSSSQDSLERAQNSIESVLSDVANQLDTLNKQVLSVKEKLKGSLSETESNVSQSFEYVKTKADEVIDTSSDKTDKNITKLQGSIESGLGSFSTSFESQITASVDETTKDVNDNFDKAKSDISSTLNATGSNVSKGLLSASKTTQDQVAKEGLRRKVVVTNTKGRVDNLFSSVANAINEQTVRFIKSVESTIKPVKAETASQISDAKQKSLSSLKQVRDLAFSEVVGTGVISGWENIKGFIRKSMVNAKTNISLVIPNLDEKDAEAISSINPRVKVDLSATGNPGILKKLSSRSNITVKVSETENLMGLIRDREEILFAPISPKAKQAVAVVSAMEGYIEELSRPIRENLVRAKKLE